MASIEPRKSPRTGRTTYRVQIERAGHPLISQSFKRKADAAAFAAAEETKINEGTASTGKQARKRTLAEAIKRYSDTVLVGRDDKSTAKHYKYWTERLGHMRLAAVTADIVVAARDDLLKTISRRGTPLAPATVKLYLESLSAVFKVARKEWRWTQYNPVSDVTRPTLPKGRSRYLDATERTALLKACQASTEPRLYPFVLLAISTGARAGELTGLAWSDVDLERGTATLRDTKNGDMRAMPIKGAALTAIAAMHDDDTPGTEHVFAGPIGPVFDYAKPFKAARDAAGIKNFRFHDCRHCTGSYLAMNGASASEIAAALGHRSLSMVKRYAHLSDGHVGSVIEKMNEKIFPTADPKPKADDSKT